MSSVPFSLPPGETRPLPLAFLSEGYVHLRIANPKAEAALAKSLSHLGQLSPIVVGLPKQGAATFELLDGFKRVRIFRRQGREEILARVIPAEKSSVCKSLMLSLHSHIHGLSELEEALIVQSLHREDGMSQADVGLLLSRHKSWVSRRIALLERLVAEAREHLVLGLLPLSVGRLLCQLPRGNQEQMLASILKHHLTARECEALLRHLKAANPSEAQALLRAPWAIEPALSAPYSGKSLDAHLQLLSKTAKSATAKVAATVSFSPECVVLLRHTHGTLEACRDALRGALETRACVEAE